MEYGEAITSDAAEQAFAKALQLWGEGEEDLHTIAARAVTGAYCACVTDGEDAAERQLSSVHAKLIDDLELRLVNHVKGNG